MTYPYYNGDKELHRTLILGVYLTLVTFPTTLAAPSTKRSATMTNNGLEKWMIPCGVQLQTRSNEVLTTDLHQLLTQIIEQSKRSYHKANEFKEKFAKKSFKTGWKQLHELHESYDSYSWLSGPTKVPKSLGKHVPHKHLNTLQMDQTLYDTYEYLQRIAVGLDQIVIDESNRSGSSSLKNDFMDLESHLLGVLCEIQTTMVEQKLPKKPDIERSIMPDDLKNGDNTNMNVRNYMILRDYINTLEYVIQCFDHLQKKL